MLEEFCIFDCATYLAPDRREQINIFIYKLTVLVGHEKHRTQDLPPGNQGQHDQGDAREPRLDGVLQVHESKYIMLHAPRAALGEIRRLLPGSEAPTVIPLEGTNDKVAVHAVCRENVFWETLENLKAAGASSLLVLPVEKMLA